MAIIISVMMFAAVWIFLTELSESLMMVSPPVLSQRSTKVGEVNHEVSLEVTHLRTR